MASPGRVREGGRERDAALIVTPKGSRRSRRRQGRAGKALPGPRDPSERRSEGSRTTS